jgi:hypothetical protein
LLALSGPCGRKNLPPPLFILFYRGITLNDTNRTDSNFLSKSVDFWF